ncbi:MAG TPA: hypothetical protein VG899_08060 [Mycobacteriales bacterium]|nr:hypothetical protein [Mycobacteriales bacterium]
MPRRPISIFAALAAAATLLTGAVALQPAAAATATKVPVVACPTTRGVSGHPPAKYADRLATNAPAALAAHLAYYSDNVRNLTPVLAPRGWKCRVTIGADGGTSVTIYPASATPTAKTGVTVRSEPACEGCVWGLVCDLVPGSAKQVGADQPACPTTRPKRERVKFERGRPHATGRVQDVVVFQDPAGVKGDGVPSGGPDPANGVLLYDWDQRDGGAASLETCTLPTAEFSTCAASASNFGARNWGMP